MTHPIRLITAILAIVLAGCGTGVGDAPNIGGGDTGGSGGGGNSSGGDPPSPTPVRFYTFHFLGVLEETTAGSFEIVQAPYGCDPPYSLGIGSPYLTDHQCVDEVTVDGIPAADSSSLKSGQEIEMYKGSIYRDGKSWIDIRRSVVGPVESVDAQHGQLTVLGQRIYVGPVTFGDAGNLARATVGERVTVSGRFTADGRVTATRIDHDVGTGPLVLRGVLNTASNGAFEIGAMRLDLSTAAVERFASGAPAAGDAVLVFADEVPQNGVLAVQTIRFAGGNWEEFDGGGSGYTSDIVDTQLMGFVTASTTQTDFEVSGFRFRPDSCTVCESLLRPLPPGILVDVSTWTRSSSIVGPGVIYGCCHHPHFTGPIDGIDAGAGTVTVLGLELQTTPATRMTDGSPGFLDGDGMRLEDLAVGDTVSVVIGGAWYMGPTYAGAIARAREGVQIRTDEFNGSLEFANPEIRFFGKSILTDADTPVTFCRYDSCSPVDQAWIFDHPPWLYDFDAIDWTIDIDPTAVPMRATGITVHVY